MKVSSGSARAPAHNGWIGLERRRESTLAAGSRLSSAFNTQNTEGDLSLYRDNQVQWLVWEPRIGGTSALTYRYQLGVVVLQLVDGRTLSRRGQHFKPNIN